MRTRLLRFFNRYTCALACTHDAKFGLTSADLHQGISYYDKLGTICPFYDRMYAVMGNIQGGSIVGLPNTILQVFECFTDSSRNWLAFCAMSQWDVHLLYLSLQPFNKFGTFYFVDFTF